MAELMTAARIALGFDALGYHLGREAAPKRWFNNPRRYNKSKRLTCSVNCSGGIVFLRSEFECDVSAKAIPRKDYKTHHPESG